MQYLLNESLLRYLRMNLDLSFWADKSNKQFKNYHLSLSSCNHSIMTAFLINVIFRNKNPPINYTKLIGG